MASLKQDAPHGPHLHAAPGTVNVLVGSLPEWLTLNVVPVMRGIPMDDYKSLHVRGERFELRIGCSDGDFVYATERLEGSTRPTTRQFLEELQDEVIRQLAVLSLNEEGGDGRVS